MTGSFIGTAIEWYDFYLFATASALVFSHVFYPNAAPGAGLLASFATFWVAFACRPIGGIIFGNIGDRIGRKRTLVVTLVMMGTATALIGLLPGYTTIGVAGPIALVVLRGIQGLAVGGEWGGAAVLATESATSRKKAFAGSWVQQGSPAGSMLATLLFLLFGLMPDEAFMSYGWRIPFLLSAVLVVVGLVIRLKVDESAEFQEMQSKSGSAKLPVWEAIRNVPVPILLGILASILGISSQYFQNTFLVAWTTSQLGISRQTILMFVFFGALVQFIWQPLAALMTERAGFAPIIIGCLVFNLVLVAPYFHSIVSGNLVYLAVMLFFVTLGGTGYYSLLTFLLTSAFPVEYRYSAISLSYQLCATIFGGTTPFFAQLILNSTNAAGVGIYYAGLIALTLVGVVGSLRYRVRKQSAVREQLS